MKIGFISLLGALVLATPAPAAVTFTTLFEFGNATFAETPRGGLIFDPATSTYFGVTQFGSAADSNFGTLYAFTNATLTPSVRHSFTGGNNGSQGGYPPVIGADGRLYGVSFGGMNGVGVAWAVNKNGTGFTVIHQFAAATGSEPHSALLSAPNGRLYGLASAGGANGLGGIFSVNPDGTDYQLLRSFTGSGGATPGAGGENPSGLLLGNDGRLYGTAASGGASDFGVIFRMALDGSAYQVLHAFKAGEGRNPTGSLVQDASGRLYGATTNGGRFDLGTIFAINSNGARFATLHSFKGNDGITPFSGPILGADGYLYGTTFYSTSNNGVVYRLPRDGSGFAVLHSFFNGADGSQPDGSLLQTSPNVFRGVASTGGVDFDGVAFEISAPIIAPKITVKKPLPIPGPDARFATLRGTTTDDLGVVKVEVNAGSGWRAAKNPPKWAARVKLRPGPMTKVKVRALDNDGKSSKVVSVTLRRKR